MLSQLMRGGGVDAEFFVQSKENQYSKVHGLSFPITNECPLVETAAQAAASPGKNMLHPQDECLAVSLCMYIQVLWDSTFSHYKTRVFVFVHVGPPKPKLMV